MKISDILKRNSQGVCFEFFPPKTEKAKLRLKATVKALKQYNPLYVSMTHGAGGVTESHTKLAVDMLLEEKDLVVMPHLTCLEASQQEVESFLEHYRNRSIENIMALRGDQPKAAGSSSLKSKDFCYAMDLVKSIKQSSNFCIGVAVYPEGHIETESLEADLNYTKQKIDAGADFGVTQMFFDNSYYYAFLDRAKKAGIAIPILPGILPLTNIAKVKEFAAICRASIPRPIEEKMEKLKDKPKDMEKLGIEFTIKQCRDLKKQGFKRLHFFTLNRPEVMKEILDEI